MDRLVLDTAEIRRCAQSLDAIRGELENAEAIARGGADAVGHRGLAEQLGDFAGNWDRKREQTVSAVAELARLCTTLADSFDGLDSDLARVQRGDG